MKTPYQIPDAESSRSLDWLDVTYPLVHLRDPLQDIPQHPFWQDADSVPQKLHNYSRVFETVHGGKIAYSPKYPEWGIYVTFGGEPLRRLRSDGLTDDDVLAIATSRTPQNIPRVDLALDWFGDGLPQDFLPHNGGIVETRMKLHSMIQSATGDPKRGATVYWGSPKSDRRIRVYDKGAEAKMLWQAWTRIEMLNRNQKAREALATMKVHRVVPSIGALLKSAFKANVDWYNRAIGDDVTLGDIPPLPLADKDPFAWYQSLLTVMKTRYHSDDEGEHVAMIRRFSYELSLLARSEPYVLQKMRGDDFTAS